MSNNEQWEISSDGEYAQSQYEQISRRLYGVVFGVATQIVEEGVCSVEDVDRDFKVGLRWALEPFELMNRIGVANALEMALTYQEILRFR